MTDHRWLPAGFVHPQRVELTPTTHLRPIRASDVDIDMVTVMANRDMLWRMYGEAWGWPPAAMTHAQDEEDLAHHAAEMVDQLSFNYAVLDDDETQLLGCVYIDPLDPTESGEPAAEVSWWLGEEVADEVRRALDKFVPEWIGSTWPFRHVTTPFQGR